MRASLRTQSPEQIVAVAVAAIGAGGGEQRSCHHCGKKGHLRHNCPGLHPEVKKFLAVGGGNAGNHGKGK